MKRVELKLLEDKALRGELKAQFYLGEIYCTGDGVRKNYLKARRWYQMAAKQGHPEAQYELGFMYLIGEGMRKNYQKGMHWMKRAATNPAKGTYYYDAKCILGYVSEKGLYGLPVNYRKALKWYRAAAPRDGQSMYSLGLMYLRGKGVARNKTSERKGMRWIRKAAKGGYVEAKNFLSRLTER